MSIINSTFVNKTNNMYELINKAQKMKTEYWTEYVLFTPLWWLALVLTVLPWVIWLKFNKKESRCRLLFVGFGVIIISSFLDFLGIQLGLWRYYYELVPLIPAYVPWDWTLMPVTIMMLIEFKPHFSPIIKAIIFTLLTSFVGEPLFQLIGYYKSTEWNIFLSLPIYCLIFMVAFWLSRRVSFSIIERK